MALRHPARVRRPARPKVKLTRQEALLAFLDAHKAELDPESRALAQGLLLVYVRKHELTRRQWLTMHNLKVEILRQRRRTHEARADRAIVAQMQRDGIEL